MSNEDQIKSDNAFYTKQLQTRAAKALGLDAENTSWFEIVGKLEEALTLSTERLKGYEEARWDVLGLTVELDKIINGDKAAERASLCDIVAQLSSGGYHVVSYPRQLAPETQRLLTSFAAELGQKARAAEVKHGYGTSWMEHNWESKCRADLLTHLKKGDPRDVAIYAAFMWNHDWKTHVEEQQ